MRFCKLSIVLSATKYKVGLYYDVTELYTHALLQHLQNICVTIHYNILQRIYFSNVESPLQLSFYFVILLVAQNILESLC